MRLFFTRSNILGVEAMANDRESVNERIKRETLELYAQLPQEYEERIKRTDIRDKVFELNYSFFGYVAAHTFINNSSISYEDKFNTACLSFLRMWWKFQYHKYRCDLSFTVFFKPRISEEIERELNEVKYSVRRSLCMEVGAQIGKPWGQVRYEDLNDPRVHLPVEKMNSLKAMFGTLYTPDIEKHEMFLEADKVSTFRLPSDNYDSIRDFLIHEMVMEESKLTDAKLLEMSEMYGLNFWDLKAELPAAEADLYKHLKNAIEI